MHIPDGFISPKVYIPAYLVATGLWVYGLKKVKEILDEKTLPFIAVLTAFSFVVMLIMIPLPGGTSAHVLGIALLSIGFGYWTAFISLSLVFFIQAVLIGDGGVTTFPINALAMGFVGGFTAYYVFRILKNFNKNLALFLAGWFSINISAFIIAVILGIQPIVDHSHDGKPLFFPFGLDITVPAVMIPHLFIGIGEGILTMIGYKMIGRIIKNER
ncbi:energy-coupling factor ABC transporter permease [Persephonella sp.]